LPEGAVARLGILRNRGVGGLVPHTLLYSPDGKLLAGADSRTVRLWDTATGRELRQFTNLSGGVPAGLIGAVGNGTISTNSLAFSPDSKHLAVGVYYSGAQVHVFDVANGREVGDWTANQSGSQMALAYTPDGKYLATLHGLDQGTRRASITFWEPTSGQQARNLQIGQQSNTYSTSWLAFSPDGRSVAAATYGRPIAIAETATGRDRAEWSLLRNATNTSAAGIAFGADSRTLYAVTPDGTIAAWDMAAGRERRRFGLAMMGSPLSMSADGKLLAVRGSDGSLRLYEPATSRLRHRISDTPSTQAFALTPDGTALASFTATGGLRFWDTATGRERVPTEGHAGPVTQVAFASDGRTLISASPEKICFWDLPAYKQRTSLSELSPGQRQRVLSPDGRWMAITGTTNSVRVVEVPGGKVVRQLDDIAGGPFGLAFTADGNTLAVSEGKTVKLWDLASGTAKRTIDVSPGTVTQVAFSPDGRRLAAVGGFGGVQLWDCDTGRRLWEQEMAVPYGRGVPVFAPDGQRLACAGGDGQVRVFDAATGKELAAVEGQSGSAPALAFTPDGQRLATGGVERQVHVWEVATGRLLHTLSGHQGSVDSLAFSADGKLLASGGSDAVVYLWDATRLGAQPAAIVAEPELSDAQVTTLWGELGDGEAAKAYAAMQTLAASPRATVAQLSARLKPVPATDAQKLAQLLADLDNARYDRRERATRELTELGDSARGALEKLLAGGPTTEVRIRAQEILKGLDQPANSPEMLRQMRAVEVLEWIATPEARAMLTDLAKGLDGARLTREAQGALERLKRQGGEAP
jgi:WD40 repeat protein